MATKSYKDLPAYQKAYKLCLDVYSVTEAFPKQDIFGLVAQMRRSAVSIPSNIAEGNRRKSRKEYVRFLSIAPGSCAELETQISLSTDLKFLTPEVGKKLLEKVEAAGRLIYKLAVSLDTQNG